LGSCTVPDRHRAQFERQVFGPKPTEAAAAYLDMIKSAMKGLDELFAQGQEKSVRWARSWFLDIGHEETTPVTLMWLVSNITINTTSVRELISELSKAPGL
jgi:hypothetical protein